MNQQTIPLGAGRGGRVICPRCFELWYQHELSWFNRGPNGLEPMTPAPPPPRKGLLVRLLRVFTVPSDDASPVDGSRLDRVAMCPSCGYEMPDTVETVQSIIIGLAGGKGSGKGHLIASIVRDLRDEGGLAGHGCQPIIALDKTERRYAELYYDPLFRDHEQLQGTLPIEERNEPLVFELSVAGADSTQTYNLMLFDAAGEQLQSDHDRRMYHKYLLYADALIFVADPMAMEKATDGMAAALRPAAPPQGAAAPAPPAQPRAARRRNQNPDWQLRIPDNNGGASPPPPDVEEPAPDEAGESTSGDSSNQPGQLHLLIGKIAREIRGSRNQPSGSPIGIPAALVVSKGDLLKYSTTARLLLDNVMPKREDALERYYPIDILTRSQQTKELLQLIAPPALLSSLAPFQHVSYHTVSATGTRVDDHGKYPRVTPRNVLEPLASLLFKLGVLREV